LLKTFVSASIGDSPPKEIVSTISIRCLVPRCKVGSTNLNGQLALLDGFKKQVFNHEDTEHTLYHRGDGPPVVIVHESPNLHPMVLRFAERTAEAGFSVWCPSLFGQPGAEYSKTNAAAFAVKACLHREFSVFASHQSSPICSWLRALCAWLHEEMGGRGVGMVGMCLTGNFALSLIAEPWMMAPVLSQPSLPYPLGSWKSKDLHVAPEIIEAGKNRPELRVLGLRFTHDWMCPRARFDSLRKHFGERFESIEINSGPGNQRGIPSTAHSVLTTDLVEEDGHPTENALLRTIEFLKEQLH
jgi:dienelactone hydrolase